MTDNFLLLTLFFPRLGLAIWYFNGWMPANPTPFAADVLLSVFIPRLLLLIWIATTVGVHGWFWAHLIAFVICLSSGSSATASKKS